MRLYLAFETKYINKNSFIFPKNQFYLIKFCFWSSSKFLGPIDFSHFSQKKIFIFNVKFLLATIYRMFRLCFWFLNWLKMTVKYMLHAKTTQQYHGQYPPFSIKMWFCQLTHFLLLNMTESEKAFFYSSWSFQLQIWLF